MSPFQTPLDTWSTSLAVAQANVERSSRAQMELLNANLKTIYLGRFDGWKQMVEAGQIDNTNPPKPPAAYILKISEGGFYFPELGTDPVCDMPPIPADHSKPAPVVSTTGNDRVQNVPPGDHYPVGFEITAPDGG